MAILRPVRGLGSARSGTSHFLLQRITGIINIVFLLVAVIVLARSTGYQHLVYLLSNPFVLAAAMVGSCSVIYHMIIGMQVVIEDYVHTPLLRNTLLFLNLIIGLGSVAMVLTALVRLGLIA